MLLKERGFLIKAYYWRDGSGCLMTIAAFVTSSCYLQYEGYSDKPKFKTETKVPNKSQVISTGAQGQILLL